MFFTILLKPLEGCMKYSIKLLYFCANSCGLFHRLITSLLYFQVSTAVRLCDGAIVVVDVVEGVCPQVL